MIEQKNPALHSKESQYLMEQTKQILMLSTKHQQQLRIIQKMEAALKLESQGASPTEISLALEEVQTTSNAKRMYQVDEHPEFLVFEHAIDSRLRPSQVESLKKLEAQNGIAMEQIMGSGKTMVLLPLIALQRADGNNLSMLAVPEALLPEVAKTLKNRLGTAFAQSVDVLHFDRNTLFDVSALLRLLDRLEIAKRERKAVLISSSSLQSLVLRFLETISSENQGYLSERETQSKMVNLSNIEDIFSPFLNACFLNNLNNGFI